MADDVKTPYEAAKRLIPPGNLPNWLNEYDAVRFASYGLYEDIYWAEPQTFKLQQRGTEENPIYVPSGRIICNTINRYTAKDFTLTVDPAFGTSSEQALAVTTFMNMFKRERLGSQHKINKLFGTIRGDAFWHITGNPLKPEGSRVSLRPIDPRMVFPINPKTDVDRIIGYDIVEQTIEGEDTYISRTRYLKSDHEDHPSFGTPGAPISVQKDLLELENWEDPEEMKIYKTEMPPTLMPAEIVNLPIYHVKNLEEPGNPFGRSEMSGLERLMAGVNQSITDEELTLALQGLGMYKSSKGQPQQNGVPIPWQLGPGKVVHDDSFDRVTGVTTVTPFLEHIKYLEDRMFAVNGASDVARGIVDVTVAESGIALALRMGPILDAAGDKKTTISEVYDNMFYDLRGWIAAYESINVGEARMVSTFGPELPKNDKQTFDELYQMVSADPPLISMGYFREAVRLLGHDIPITETGVLIAEEMAAFAEVSDPAGARMDSELDGAGAPPEDI